MVLSSAACFRAGKRPESSFLDIVIKYNIAVLLALRPARLDVTGVNVLTNPTNG